MTTVGYGDITPGETKSILHVEHVHFLFALAASMGIAYKQLLVVWIPYLSASVQSVAESRLAKKIISQCCLRHSASPKQQSSLLFHCLHYILVSSPVYLE